MEQVLVDLDALIDALELRLARLKSLKAKGLADDEHLLDLFTTRTYMTVMKASGSRLLSGFVEWLAVPEGVHRVTGAEKLRRQRNVGAKTLEEVRQVLAQYKVYI